MQMMSEKFEDTKMDKQKLSIKEGHTIQWQEKQRSTTHYTEN